METVTNPSVVEDGPGRVLVRSEFAPLHTVVVSRSQFGAPDAMIEGCLRLPHRRLEVLASREILADRAFGGRCIYVGATAAGRAGRCGRRPRSRAVPWGAIAGYGVTVEYVDFAVTRSFGGAFRCTTQVLHRE